MTLSEYILQNLDCILDEWERFAFNIPSAQGFDPPALRDHARGILETIAEDMKQPQSALEQAAKGRGLAPPPPSQTSAQMHGVARVAEGFSVSEAMSEYRALRACVLRLWQAHVGRGEPPLEDLMRFNEGIDQALTESLARYTEIKDNQAILFDALLSSSPDLNYIVDTDGHLVYANKAFAQTFHLQPGNLTGKSIFSLLAPFAPDLERKARNVIRVNATYLGELRLGPGRDSGSMVFEYLLIPVIGPDGKCVALAGTARDVTERQAAEENARRNANFDQLTDLPNRSLFRERLDHELKHAQRTGRTLALLYIDLDAFKAINDTLGHASGDQLLQQVAGRISHCVRETDTVARLGGDEFTVIVTDVRVPEAVPKLTAKLISELARPFALSTAEVSISASIGISRYPHDAHSAEELVRNADSAMYVAKNAGRNRFHFFDEQSAS